MVKKEPYILKKETLISEVLTNCPKVAEYLIGHGLACITCVLSNFETLEEGAEAHGMSDRTLAKMIKEINNKLKKEV